MENEKRKEKEAASNACAVVITSSLNFYVKCTAIMVLLSRLLSHIVPLFRLAAGEREIDASI